MNIFSKYDCDAVYITIHMNIFFIFLFYLYEDKIRTIFNLIDLSINYLMFFLENMNTMMISFYDCSFYHFIQLFHLFACTFINSANVHLLNHLFLFVICL